MRPFHILFTAILTLSGQVGLGLAAQPVEMAIAGAVAIPVGTLRDQHTAGVSTGLRVAAPWIGRLRVTGWLDYQILVGRRLAGFRLAGDMKILALGIGLRHVFVPTTRVRPAIEVGVGNYRFEQPNLFLERKMGVYVSALVERQLGSRGHVGLETSYHYTFSDRFIHRAQFIRIGLHAGLRLGG